MIKVRFSLYNGISEYYWIKRLSSKEAILDYISKKKLPFEELNINDVKYKIL